MTADVPAIASDSQSPLLNVTANAKDAKSVDYSSGELVWKSANNNDKPLFSLKTTEIVFILKTPDSEGRDGGYLVYSLSEDDNSATNDTREDGSNSEGNDEKKKLQFRLSVLFSPQESELPEKVREDFLLDLDELKADGQFWYSNNGTSRRSVDVIISTGSGTGKAKGFYTHVLRPLLDAVGLSDKGTQERAKARSLEYQATVTESSRTITDFAKAIKGSPTVLRTIILLSGDGGVIDLLNGLDKAEGSTSESATSYSPPTVAILPLGTGNALFHSLHKPLYTSAPPQNPSPSNLVLALRTLFKGIAAPLPTFRASFSPRSRLISAPELEKTTGSSVVYGNSKEDANAPKVMVDHLVGAIVASYGFHASLVWESDTPAYRVHGDKRFGMAAAELLKESHGYEAVVEVRRRQGGGAFTRLAPKDGDNKFNYVLTTMVSNLEKTFTISPASKPLDGQLRLVSFGNVGGDKTMEIMMAAYRGGEHVGMKWKKEGGEEEHEQDGVGYDEVDEVRVTILEEDPRWRKVCIDGTIVEIEKNGWMSVKRELEGQERIWLLVDKEVLADRQRGHGSS